MTQWSCLPPTVLPGSLSLLPPLSWVNARKFMKRLDPASVSSSHCDCPAASCDLPDLVVMLVVLVMVVKGEGIP